MMGVGAGRSIREEPASTSLGPRRRIGGRGLLLAAIGLALAAAIVLLPRLRNGVAAEPAEATRARQAIAAKDWPTARTRVAAWVSARPQSPEAQQALATVEFAEGRLNEAFDAVKLARKLGGPEDDLERLEGLILAKAGESARAEPLLIRVIERAQGKDREVAEALSLLLLNTYKFPQARILLNKWIEVSPGDAKPYLWLTEIDRRTDTAPDETIAHYKAALERDATLVDAHRGLAEVLWAAKRSAEAAAEYDIYLKARPDDPKGHLGAARVARDMGDDARVETHLRNALKLVPNDPVALKELGALEQRRGKPAEALAALDRSYKLDPYDAEVLYQRGLLLARLGRGAEAAKAQREAARLREDQAKLLEVQNKLLKHPDDISLRGQVARWMFEHGQADEAARWARLILERTPNDKAMNGLLADYHEAKGEAGLANSYRLRVGGP